jgi:hypothetical protein
VNTRLVLLVLLLLATGGCGNVYLGPDGADPAARPLRCQQPPDQPSGMHVLLAQSVPGASAVPCLTRDVPDWLVTQFEVRDGKALISFTDRFGRDDDTVALEFAAGCDVGDATETPAGLDGVRRYERRGRIFLVGDGACTTVRYSLPTERAGEISGALGFVTRAEIDRQIRTASDGHLHLDRD